MILAPKRLHLPVDGAVVEIEDDARLMGRNSAARLRRVHPVLIRMVRSGSEAAADTTGFLHPLGDSLKTPSRRRPPDTLIIPGAWSRAAGPPNQ